MTNEQLRRRLLLALLALALPLLACGGVDKVVDKVVGDTTGAVVGHNLCIKGCGDVDMEFLRYKHGEWPDCWCSHNGEPVLLW